ncbi:hypothetical protein GDO81_004161 [Engystomops pustulosus]|uniref:Uncharacterized protein n=1 Tax=Engystomops pustulosus TaxID=76066 RepID=A0AAV6ZWE2_ENGPU|nr:hypothetical protein GDO81_004161 [Engystomops pustulosus]
MYDFFRKQCQSRTSLCSGITQYISYKTKHLCAHREASTRTSTDNLIPSRFHLFTKISKIPLDNRFQEKKISLTKTSQKEKIYSSFGTVIIQ